jgi:hypothetical protein
VKGSWSNHQNIKITIGRTICCRRMLLHHTVYLMLFIRYKAFIVKSATNFTKPGMHDMIKSLLGYLVDNHRFIWFIFRYILICTYHTMSAFCCLQLTYNYNTVRHNQHPRLCFPWNYGPSDKLFSQGDFCLSLDELGICFFRLVGIEVAKMTPCLNFPLGFGLTKQDGRKQCIQR